MFQDINNNNQIDFATELEETKNYYPFGLEWDAPTQETAKYRNAYNNKERTPHTRYLDFGARNYIKTANVFDGPDPISSSFPHLTTINYASLSPVTNIDLHGLQRANYMWIQQLEKETGYNFSDNSQAKSFVKKEGKSALKAMGTALLEVGLVALDVATMGRSRPITSGIKARRAAKLGRTIAGKADDAVKSKVSTLEPGPHATESIPARSQAQKFSKAERAKVNKIGSESGCHTCGTKKPGTKSGDFVPDHQPVSALTPKGTDQRLFPHCIGCSRSQGGTVSKIKQQRKNE